MRPLSVQSVELARLKFVFEHAIDEAEIEFASAPMVEVYENFFKHTVNYSLRYELLAEQHPAMQSKVVRWTATFSWPQWNSWWDHFKAALIDTFPRLGLERWLKPRVHYVEATKHFEETVTLDASQVVLHTKIAPEHRGPVLYFIR